MGKSGKTERDDAHDCYDRTGLAEMISKIKTKSVFDR
jgi:hypothetical protein